MVLGASKVCSMVKGWWKKEVEECAGVPRRKREGFVGVVGGDLGVKVSCGDRIRPVWKCMVELS
jgi:hypothetical protein